MRKIISLSMSVALSAVVFAAVPAAADSATVARGGDCAMPGFGEGGELVFGGMGTVKKVERNENTAMMICKGTGITNDFGPSHQVSGFGCYVMLPDEDWILTTDSRVNVTRNGKATMKCTATLYDGDRY
jgi:hypothetical protein